MSCFAKLTLIQTVSAFAFCGFSVSLIPLPTVHVS